MKKFYIISCHVLWRELSYFASQSRHAFDFNFLRQGLHDTPDELRRQLQAAIDNASKEYDAILVGYGLCSNGIVDIKATTHDLVFMRGHDCITFFLGSRDRYQDYFDSNPGTYWYTSGWIETGAHPMPGKERLEYLRQQYEHKYGADNADYLMRMEQGWIDEYSKAAYIDMSIINESRYKEYTKQCADYLSWDYDELSGNMSLIRRFIEGDWDDEDFLIVRKGYKIAASHNSKIITCKADGTT